MVLIFHTGHSKRHELGQADSHTSEALRPGLGLLRVITAHRLGTNNSYVYGHVVVWEVGVGLLASVSTQAFCS